MVRLAASTVIAYGLAACGSNSGGTASDARIDAASDAGGCALTGATTQTATVTNGCTLVSRDTSACMAARAAQGLSGAWLAFSCRVTETKMTGSSGDFVRLQSDGRPDYKSNYFPSSDPCYAAYSPGFPDPNLISAQQFSFDIPLAPTTSHAAMGLGPVGMAIDGVAIFDNQAAPGDDIYKEAGSFDRCGGHPAQGGVYHFHSEPYAISSGDDHLIGVLRDGYFAYGRYDTGNATPTLDIYGGHTGSTADSASPAYHYHANQQTSATPGTSGEMQWFLTTGTYEGSTLP